MDPEPELMSTARSSVRLLVLPALAVILWALWVARGAGILLNFARAEPRVDVWLYDYNVYHTAAGDLLDRILYRGALALPGYELPIDTFNYPPMAAAWAAPLLPFGREPGGIAWLVLGIVATSAGALLGARALRLPWSWAWVLAGGALALYALSPYIAADVALGNNNHLVFALVAGFALAHLRGHQRLAGLLLALAIATKLWPVALVVPLLRDRRWPELRWTAGVVAIQVVVAIAWLGPDVIGPMVPAVLGQNLGRDEVRQVAVLWTTAFRVWWEWWPAWGGYAVALMLVAIPATGRLGIGLGILAGLSLNANLWHHYAPVFVLGLALMIAGLVRQRLEDASLLNRRQGGRLRSIADGQRPAFAPFLKIPAKDRDSVGSAGARVGGDDPVSWATTEA